jgi:hypothetical protein
LATINVVDFLYTCPGHLSDQGFATLVSSDVPKVTISAEEIAKVKAEWEEKEKKRKEKEKEEKDKEKDKDNKAGDKGKEESKSPKIPGTPSTPPPPAHERYTLHRNFFSREYKGPFAVHKMG